MQLLHGEATPYHLHGQLKIFRYIRASLRQAKCLCLHLRNFVGILEGLVKLNGDQLRRTA